MAKSETKKIPLVMTIDDQFEMARRDSRAVLDALERIEKQLAQQKKVDVRNISDDLNQTAVHAIEFLHTWLQQKPEELRTEKPSK